MDIHHTVLLHLPSGNNANIATLIMQYFQQSSLYKIRYSTNRNNLKHFPYKKGGTKLYILPSSLSSQSVITTCTYTLRCSWQIVKVWLKVRSLSSQSFNRPQQELQVRSKHLVFDGSSKRVFLCRIQFNKWSGPHINVQVHRSLGLPWKQLPDYPFCILCCL